ncbi:MAG: hypothetical protein DRI54_09030 [Bacteroidetes bacterium]|nr:MAG: hypothetical protein DRI54_09030 [Bacteroidota bacterium]
MKKVFLLFFLVTSTCSYVKSQDFNYARLVVIYGNNIPFNFNSIENFKNGIRIEDGTILGITMVDSVANLPTVHGFDLQFRSFNSQGVIQGGGANSLPLNTIEVEASDFSGLGGAVYSGLQPLSPGWINLVQYTDPAAPPFNDLNYSMNQVRISYECGINISLLGEISDYYNVEIEFELIPTGPGF